MSPNPNARSSPIFWLSVLSLFVELMIIRWVGTEIRIFAYLQNSLLVTCFLGLGIGCWTCRQPVRIRDSLIPLAIIVGVLIPVSWYGLGNQISLMLNAFGDVLMFTETVTSGRGQAIRYLILGLIFTFILLSLVWYVFLPIGRLLGRMLADHPQTVWAYSVNVAGSLVGVWLFVALSGFQSPPVIWMMTAAGLTVMLLISMRERVAIELPLLITMVVFAFFGGFERGAEEIIWSPYQKLSLYRTEVPGEGKISVNNSGGFQIMMDLRPEETAKDPVRFPPHLSGLTQYDLACVLHPSIQKMVILGAGSGNGSAAALRHDVPKTIAVDIDPVILGFGNRHHPEHPYQSPKVQTICDDARSFLASTDEKFDVIAYEFLDSHAQTAMTNTRLDHYVYTRESFERAKEQLAPGGLIILRFGYEKPFIVDRLYNTLTQVFNEPPLMIGVASRTHGVGGLVLIAGDQSVARKQIADDPRLQHLADLWEKENPIRITGTTMIATDDWPYLYLESPSIPMLYWLMGFMLLVLFARALAASDTRAMLSRWSKSHWHFFFLGAAFLLLEVQNVSKASVVLGSTWQVNAVIISAVLILVLISNLIEVRFPGIPINIVFLLLIATCLMLYVVDLTQFAFLPFASRVLIVGGFVSLPVLFSGIIFIRSFKSIPDKDAALGANLLGSLFGGLLQSLTFITGIKALLIIVAVLYICGWMTRPQSLEAAKNP